MAYESLKSEIRQYIKTNGQNEITGQILQNILIDMVNQYPSLDGYATQQWVLNQNYVTSAILANYLPLSAGQNNALTGDLYVGANSIHLDYNTNAGSAYSNISHEKIVVGSTLNIINGEFTATIKNDGTIQLHSYQDVLGEVVEYNTILGPHAITTGGNVTADAFVKAGGTAAQFLKADGSVDNSTYLTSLAVAGLSDVVLTNLTNGQALVYDSATSKWVNTTIQGGGGGTVTSIATGTGLTGGPITTSGTISISSTYQTYISHGESAYNSLANYLPLNGGGTITNANDYSLNISEKGLLFYYNGSLYGSLSLTSTPDGPVFDARSNLTIGGNTIWHAGNFTPSDYLPLSAGSTKALTGDLYVGGNKIQLDGSSVSMFYLDKTKLLLDDTLLSYYAMELTKSSLEFRYRPAAQVAYKTTTITPSSITSPQFVKTGGTSSQFLKADGSVDSNTYALSSSLSSYLPLSGGTLSGILTIAPPASSGYQDALVLHDSGSGSHEGARIRFTSASYTTGITLGPNSDKTVLLINDTDIIATRTWVGQNYLPLSAGNTNALTGTLYTTDINVQSGYGITVTSGGIGIGTAPATGYAIDADGSIRATGIYVGSYAVRTTNDTYISGNTIYVGNDSLTVSSGGSGTVTSVATGTGLTGGPITTSGTISINQTYLGYISHGESAYNSLSNYLPLSAGSSYPLTGDLHLNNNTIYCEGSQSPYTISNVIDYQGIGLSRERTGAISELWTVNIDADSISLNSSYEESGETETHMTEITPSGISIDGNSVATQYWVEQQGYVTSSGVTSIATGTGLTGGPITTNGTISISSTYQTYISHGESAYNSLSNYLPLSAGSSYPLTGDLHLNNNTIYCEGSQSPYTISNVIDYQGIGLSRERTGSIAELWTVNIDADSISLNSSYEESGETETHMTEITPSGITIDGNSVATQYWVGQQGYALAASLSNYLPLSGGTMTGTIYRAFSAAASEPLIWMNGTDSDNYLWQISAGTTTKQYYGYGLLYIGTGESVSNYLRLVADNQNGTDVTAIGINQSGQVGIGSDASTLYRLKVYGTFATTDNAAIDGNLSCTGDVSIVGDMNVNDITANSFIKDGGTSAQFLKADGSVDSNTYALSSSLSSYLPLSGGTLSGILTITPPASSSYQDALVLHDSNSGSQEGARIRFTSASYTTGITLGPNSDKTALLINDTYTIIHSGNIASYLGSNLVTSVCGYNGAVSKAELEQGLGLSSYVKPTVVDALADGVLIVYDSGGWVTTSGSTYLSGYLPLSAGNTKALTGTLYTRDINVASGYGITVTCGGIGIGTACGTGYVLDADGTIRATGIYVGSYAVRTTNDTYISGNTIYVGSNSLTVSSGGSGTVTSVATGTGLTGGTITTSGTISISSTYRTYISNGNTAYGWGNHANAGYAQIVGNGGSNPNILFNYSGTYFYLQCYQNSIGMGQEWSNSLIVDSNGNASAISYSNRSDIRRKDVVSYNVEPTFELIANAPTIKFKWKDAVENTKTYIGSIAQYWQYVLPESVMSDAEGYLTMQYDVIALLSAISVAKRVTEHERRIETLERENAMLRLELNQIKSAS